MDASQQWALTIAEQALADYGYPQRPIDTEHTAVILGTAMGGDMHYLSHLRIAYPEYARVLNGVDEFQKLPAGQRSAILQGWQAGIAAVYPEISEDSMPGELANVVSGRVANLLNLRGPNFVTDAACASSFAAIQAAMDLLDRGVVDLALSGGVDHNMDVSAFVKFCKIGALSANGSRPFGEGADGFVMGEGAAAFLLKRLEDAERDGDKIYAVIRGIGGSSDGKGKGITAPNPIGQRLAMERAWQEAGLDPGTASMVEAHGTSTKVGDVVEVESLAQVFQDASPNSIALGSVKSNIGHLKAGTGAAGLLKAALAICHRVLPPTLNAEKPNPNINFGESPFFLNHEVREWPVENGMPRRCGVSAYGFGGTNFHVVLEEHRPGSRSSKGRLQTGVSIKGKPELTVEGPTSEVLAAGGRGILALGAHSPVELKNQLDDLLIQAQNGWTPQPFSLEQVNYPERLVIDYGGRDELVDRLQKAQRGMGFDSAQAWSALQAQGIFRGGGKPAGKIAFLFPGQGSQYLNMGRELAAAWPEVGEVFAEADRVMAPILGRPLSEYIFLDSQEPGQIQQAELRLMQTAITQPAMLAMDIAMFRLLGKYGFHPDMAMGHSLGEYAALIATGSMPFEDALEAVAARGREMEAFSVEDNGWMAAVMAPYVEVDRILAEIDGYVVAANINSYNQCVIGGASKAVERAIQVFQQNGFEARRIPVSHAFHTRIVAPASVPLRRVLDRLRVNSPAIPLISNVSGEFYPSGPDEIRGLLQQQVASPVQWIKGLETLYDAGARAFIEVGPKKALKGFVDNVLADRPDVLSLFTNHPKMGEMPTFNQALCGLYAAGYAIQEASPEKQDVITVSNPPVSPSPAFSMAPANAPAAPVKEAGMVSPVQQPAFFSEEAVGQIVAQALKGLIEENKLSAISGTSPEKPYDRRRTPLGSVVISGTGLGLPGAEKTSDGPREQPAHPAR